MAILDVFKKKKKEKKKEAIKKDDEKKPKQPSRPEVKTPKVRAQAKIGHSYRILKTPQVTEKATDLAGKNQYTFKVFPRANKTEVKKAVQSAFDVDVVSLKIINVHRKKRRLGKIEGMKPGYKKAIVKIKKGQKIELLPR